MSDDLISRKSLKANIEAIRECWATSPYVSADDIRLYAKVFNTILQCISDCPTAFDKERVIALNNSIIDDVQDIKTLRKELAMWQEYKEVVHKKTLEKDSTEHAAKEFIYSEKSVNDIIGKLQHKINSCIDFIGQIEDSVVRQACFYKWIEGKTWIQVGFKMNMTDEAIRIRVNRYLRKIKRN